jgi:hypothetical protein
MKGKCVNIDCPKFEKNFEIPEGEDFICPECRQNLNEVTDECRKGFFAKFKWPLIIAPVVIVAVVLFLIFCNDKTTLPTSKTTIPINTKEVNSPIVERPVSLGKDTIVKIDTVVREIYKVDTLIKETERVVERTITPTVPTKTAMPTKNYPFGTYSGSLKNGIPEGDGKMTYNRRIQIAKHDTDSPAHYAEAGDYFDGQWGNGDIVSGYLYNRDGSIKERILAPKRFNAYDLNDDK